MRTIILTFAAALLAGAAQATTLIDNINGIQADDKGQLQRFKAIVIGDDGKILAVIKPNELVDVRANERIDGGGRTVLPGLIDAHGHVIGLGQALLSLDLVGTGSIDELKSRLRNHAAANPGTGWVTGRGWNQELWPVKVFPTSADLDAVVSDRPVVLYRVDGHALVANSKALELAGITDSTPAPSGGRIENGLFVDAAQTLIESKIPEPTDADLDAALAKSQEAMLKVGLVGAHDMGTSIDDWNAMRRAGEKGDLKVRVFGYAAGLPAWRIINEGAATGWEFRDRLALLGTKFYADGALGSRGAFLKHPYHDQPNSRGLSLISDADLTKAADEVANGRGQIAIHAIGDAANEQVIRVLETIGNKYGRYHRGRIEHLQIADPKDLPRLKPAGIVASMQPTHQTSDRTMAEARLGPNRLDGAYAWSTILKLGVPLAFGSDFPVESPDPFPGLMAAISRQDLQGQPPGGWRAQEKLTLGQALHAFTRGAAYAGFAEKVMGAIEPGYWADFIIVDTDPTTANPQALGRTKVLETWVGGEKVFSASN